jgi:predicted dehydrogenase
MKRRDFIKTGAGAFFIASAGNVFGANAPANRVRLAIVGCHAKGRGIAVAKAAMRVPGVEIAYVCDVDSRARDFAADVVEKMSGFKPRKEADLRKVLEDKLLDGVILETPDHWHAYGAVLAMNAGKAVYVEKPCAFCPREGEVLIETQKKTGMVFQMGNQRRASLSFKEAIDFVRNENPIGKLKWAKCWYMANRASIGTGKVVNVPEWLDWELWQGPAPRENYRDNIVHYNWHWFRNWGTAETGNNAPHFADAARWALEVDYPEEIQTMSQTLFHRGDDYQFPDTFNSSFRFPGGKFITFELSSRANGNPFMNASTGALVYGEKGSLYLSPGDSATVFDEKSKVIKTWKPGGSTQVGSLTNPTAELDFRHMTKFVECIRAKDLRTNSPVEEAVKSTFMPLVANIAGEIGETVRLDPKTGKLLTKAAEKLWSREYAKGWEALV